MAPPKDFGLDITYKRAMLFLHLAVEQLRLYDNDIAEAVFTVHVVGLSEVFDGVIQAIEKQQRLTAANGDGNLRSKQKPTELDHISQEAFEQALKDMPNVPPGLGFGVLPEKSSQAWNMSADSRGTPQATRYSQWSPPGLGAAADARTAVAAENLRPSSSNMQALSRSSRAQAPNPFTTDYGVIGQRKVSSNSGDSSAVRRSSALAALRQDTEPLPMSSPAFSSTSMSLARASGLKPLPYGTESTPKSTPELVKSHLVRKSSLSPPTTDRVTSSGSSTTSSKVLAGAPASAPSTIPPQQQPSKASSHGPPTTSWATIAAIPRTKTAQLPFSGHLTTQALPQATRKPRSNTSSSVPTEPLPEQLRAIWLANLTPTFTLRDVSAHITEGPVMSILVAEDMAPMLLGRSACIIFQHAEHAHAFLVANNNGEPVEAGGGVNPLPATRYLADAPAAYILPGAPYPADADILAMGPPLYARRRLKWSRSRLFYDVPLAMFKQDVYEIVGGDNVEMFHFYNAGECTVVFSSVKVAAVCLERFMTWKKEVAARDAEGNLVTAVTVGGKGGGAAVGGEAGAGVVSGKGGRYERVDVGYVHDFNEAPAKLFSQYGADGRVKKTACQMGVEGWYGGPLVKGGRV